MTLRPDFLFEPAHRETPCFEDFVLAVAKSACTKELHDG